MTLMLNGIEADAFC